MRLYHLGSNNRVDTLLVHDSITNIGTDYSQGTTKVTLGGQYAIHLTKAEANLLILSLEDSLQRLGD